MIKMTRICSACLVALVSTFLAVVPSVQGHSTERYLTGKYERGACEIQGLYPRDRSSFNRSSIIRRYPLWQTWTDRCNECVCTTSGAQCQGTASTCTHWYDFSQEDWCLEWSEDGCCCEKMGCTIEGQTYELGESIPYGRGNPCLTCTCEIGSTLKTCLQEQCGVMELQCRDMTVTYEGCCPNYNCPHGVVCDEIPDPYPDTPQHELLNWYGQLEPIRQGMTHNYHVGTWDTYICKCEAGGEADCRMETLGDPTGNWN